MATATTADIDMVRLLIGDLGEPPILREDQIGLLLEVNALDRYAAAADCAEAIAAMYAGRVDTRVGILSASDSQLSKQYRDLADSLRSRYNKLRAGGAAPWAGGVRVADRVTRAADDTLAAPFFVRQPLPRGDSERC